MVFMTKVEEPKKQEKLESFEHDAHDDLMQQLHQKRTQIEQGLTKASDDLRNQMDEVRFLKQFVKQTKLQLENQRSEQAVMNDNV